MSEIVFDFKKGDTFNLEQKIHIVEVIDEGLTFTPMVVYRYWTRHKQRWQYEIESAYMLSGRIERRQQKTAEL